MIFFVATPIGNLADITYRAVEILNTVDIIYCEDTRTSSVLLNHYGIKKPLRSYHDHNARGRRDEIINHIESGKTLAFISDAGMPMISDPGYDVVQLCSENGWEYTVIPGVNAVTMGLCLSGLPTDNFTFVGFLPSKLQARRQKLREYQAYGTTLVLYESPHRLMASLQDIIEILGDRQGAVMREMTKKFEQTIRGKLSEILQYFTENPNKVRGEIVISVFGFEPPESCEDDIIEFISHYDDLRSKDLLKLVMQHFKDVNRNQVYQLIMEHRKKVGITKSL